VEHIEKRVSLSAGLIAETKNFLMKLLNLGVKGAAEYEKKTSSGIPPEHLVTALAKADDCRLKVWLDLNDRLLPKEEKGCRHPDHGVEFWGHTERWTANSGWRRGGSSEFQYCGAAKLNREKKYQNRTVMLLDTGQGHDYRYTCVFEDRWQPIYKFADTPACRR
jgi:hypothetical protein